MYWTLCSKASSALAYIVTIGLGADILLEQLKCRYLRPREVVYYVQFMRIVKVEAFAFSICLLSYGLGGGMLLVIPM